MKKLMFAAAIAASAAAFADPINAISFENSDYALIDNATNLTARADKPDPDGRNDNGTYFLYEAQSGSSDSSFVTNAAAAFTDKGTAYFSGLENFTNEKYLALDTEGGTLWRSIGTLTGNSDALGTARTVNASTGTYLDTLVQFTVTEDEAPELGTDDKLAIWLQAGVGTTNLMVKAAVVDDQAGRTETTFTVTGATVEPGNWYRLTVKAFADITDGELIPGFQIFLDGNLVTADQPTLTAGYLALIDSDSHYADLVACKYFASLKTTTTLQGVGFQGTGAVDEIVWTEDDPFPAATVEFTLTYSGDANTTLGAVTYTVGEGEPTPVTFTENAAQIPEKASVTISNATFATGYQLAAFTVGGTPVESPSFPYSFTITSNTTVSITSELIPSEDWKKDPATEITEGATAAQAYPGLASSALASADAQKLTTWAQRKNIAYNDIKNDTTGTYTEAYLLNCAVADVAEEKEEFVANITIGANGTPVVTAPDGKTYNGKLQLKGKVNLSDAEWTNVESASTTYKFYMYELSL